MSRTVTSRCGDSDHGPGSPSQSPLEPNELECVSVTKVEAGWMYGFATYRGQQFAIVTSESDDYSPGHYYILEQA